MEDTITPEEVSEVAPTVVRIIADALDRDVAEVHLDSRLIDDLEAESIDFLDIVFRLERTFKIKIPRGKIVEDTRGNLSDEEFHQLGVLTDAGRSRLQAYLNEVPPERFRPGLTVADIPRLFSVETFCKVVVRALRTPGDCEAQT
jgi:acyl carrier protein